MNKFTEMVLNFFKKMLSDHNSVSSKRVVGFGSFLLIIACTIVNLCGGTIVAQFIFLGLITLICACFGLNTYIQSKQLSLPETKEDITQLKKP